MTTLLKRYRFDTEQYAALARQGILGPDARVELLDGEIVEMSPISPKHLWTVNNLNRLLQASLGTDAELSIQNPVHLSAHNEPEPDVAVLRLSPGLHRRLPSAQDILFLIEASDSSLLKDLHVKLPLYAAASIPEVWIVDLERDVVTQHCLPVAGTYTVSAEFARGDVMESRTCPGCRIAVDDIIPD